MKTTKPLSPDLLRHAILVYIVALAATVLWIVLKGKARMPYADEFEYLGFGLGIAKFGVFGQVKDPTVAPDNTMYFPPLYPYFLAWMLKLDAGFRAAAECFIGHRGTQMTAACSPGFGIIIWVQAALAALPSVFTFGAAREVSGSNRVGWIAGLLVLIPGLYAYYTQYLLTENFSLPLTAAFAWALVATWRRRTMNAALFAGAALGLLVLTRAGWEFSLLVIVPILIWAAISEHRKGDPKRGWLIPICFAVAFVSVLSPWMIRNAVTFDRLAVTGGYGNSALSHRIPYNRMRLDEWRAAFIYWLPDFGDGLAKKWFDRDSYRRLDFEERDGFYKGMRSVVSQEIEAARGEMSRQEYMLRHEVLGNLPKHVLVTFAMVWRGMWVGKYWGLIGWCFLLPVLVWAVARRHGALLVLAAPPIFMLGLNAFVSVSVPRYNLALMPVIATAVAFAAIGLWEMRRSGARRFLR